MRGFAVSSRLMTSSQNPCPTGPCIHTFPHLGQDRALQLHKDVPAKCEHSDEVDGDNDDAECDVSGRLLRSTRGVLFCVGSYDAGVVGADI